MGSEQRNALLAVVLSGIILFGWQFYFAPQKSANGPIEPAQTAATTVENKATETSVANNGPIEPTKNETFNLIKDGLNLEFDNTLTVLNFQNPHSAFLFSETVGSKTPLKVEFDFGNGFQSLHFVKLSDDKYTNAEHDLTFTLLFNENGVANFDFASSKDFKYKFIFAAEAKKLENGQERFFSYYTDKLNHLQAADEEEGDRSIKWAGIDFNYHLFGLYFDKEQTLLYKNHANSTFTMFSHKTAKTLNYRLVFVKKEYNYLTGLGHNLNNSVDFGIWGFFAVWILKGLQFFYKFVPNYGVSIILLTLLIRLITFPLQYKSFVSMKKLQLVQPELTKIREKFKDDPQRLQKESMELFKKSGANPLGGCLPLLLQMPVFFAFYKVLYSAVELVDAPFILWIHDLSNKDPYFVLPVLMTAAMFMQQKLTPNTISDPVQKKVMMFMPLIFGFIMKDLPSGLSLYIFVSTLFGILQQMMVFNAKSSSTPVVV